MNFSNKKRKKERSNRMKVRQRQINNNKLASD